jgi:hypothetical protein
VQRGTDEWILEVPQNGATIRCLPLGDGTKIRGVRADLLVVDEFAFLPEPIIGEILRPFLAANSRIKEQRTIQEREDEMVKAGVMTTDQRTILEDRKKVIFLSSACYQFEHMFKFKFLIRFYKFYVMFKYANGLLCFGTVLPQIPMTQKTTSNTRELHHVSTFGTGLIDCDTSGGPCVSSHSSSVNTGIQF